MLIMRKLLEKDETHKAAVAAEWPCVCQNDDDEQVVVVVVVVVVPVPAACSASAAATDLLSLSYLARVVRSWL